MELVEILKTAVQSGASDIHIVVGRPPMMRHDGDIEDIPGFSVINGDESKRLIYSILYEEQRAKLEEHWELDCSFAVSGLARFRVNVLLQKNGVEAVKRVISSKIPTPEQLRLSRNIIGTISTGPPAYPGVQVAVASIQRRTGMPLPEAPDQKVFDFQ